MKNIRTTVEKLDCQGRCKSESNRGIIRIQCIKYSIQSHRRNVELQCTVKRKGCHNLTKLDYNERKKRTSNVIRYVAAQKLEFDSNHVVLLRSIKTIRSQVL